MAFGPQAGLDVVDALVAEPSLRELSPAAERARRSAREARTPRRGARGVRARGRADAQRARAHAAARTGNCVRRRDRRIAKARRFATGATPEAQRQARPALTKLIACDARFPTSARLGIHKRQRLDSPIPMERYRRLVDASPDGILIVDDDRIAFVNPAAVSLFGAHDAAQVIGRSIVDCLDADGTRRPAQSPASCADGRGGAVRGTDRPAGWHAARRQRHGRAIATRGRSRRAGHRARYHRAAAGRSRPPRKRRTADARRRRRAGRGLGLEPRNQRRRVLRAMEADARLLRRRNRAARQRLGTPGPPGRSGRAPTGRTTASRAASERPTRRSSGCGTRTATTSTCCRAAFRCAASRADRSCASSAPTSTSPSGSGPKRRCARTKSG